MRAISVAFSPARPSRLKNEPGIFPAAYIRSSTSTVSGRKSTSRRFPAVAVPRTIVSPARTTTEPEACLAMRPVSNEISVPAISTETVVTSAMCSFPARVFEWCAGAYLRSLRYVRHHRSEQVVGGHTGMRAPGDEQRGRRRHSGADAGVEVALDPREHLLQ